MRILTKPFVWLKCFVHLTHKGHFEHNFVPSRLLSSNFQCQIIRNRIIQVQPLQTSVSNSKTTNTKHFGTSCSVYNIDGDKEPNMPLHIPVMAKEVLEYINPVNNGVYVDMTFGAGGHTMKILEQAPNAKIFCLDRDLVAYEMARKLSNSNDRIVSMHGRFSEVLKLLKSHGVSEGGVDGILFDVGVSSMQFDSAERGFAISKDAPLDMRMEGKRDASQVSAADVVNLMEERDLHKIIKHYGEEKKARLIARAIVDHRLAFGKIKTTRELANIVAAVYQNAYTQDKMQRPSHVATKTFQALRIFVNNELNELHNGLELAHRLLRPAGVCVAIAFHSLEDRIIKRHFHGIDMDAQMNMSAVDQMRNSAKIYDEATLNTLLQKRWERLTKKVVLPSEEEQLSNPRGRSAKLRAGKKLVT